MPIAFLALGSSIGDKEKTLKSARKNLEKIGKVLALSSFHVTKAEGGVAKNTFLNAAVKLETELSPQELLQACQKIEKEHGRVRKQKWEDRTLDIDIITYDNRKIDELNLKIPHPLAAQRSFILEPLKEIADFRIEGGILIISEE